MQRAVVSGDRTLQRKEFEKQDFKKHKDCQAGFRVLNGYRTWISECRGMKYDFYNLIYNAQQTILLSLKLENLSFISQKFKFIARRMKIVNQIRFVKCITEVVILLENIIQIVFLEPALLNQV